MIRDVSIIALAVTGLAVVAWELQRYGARRLCYLMAVVAGVATAGLWIAEGPLISGPWWVLPALVLLAGVALPDQFVRWTGGPKREWGLVRSFEMAAARLATAQTEAEAAAGMTALQRLDRWRSKRTTAFIDLVQMTYGTPAAERPPDQVERLERMRRQLWAGLKPKPAWTEEVRLAWLRAAHGEAAWERADQLTRRGEGVLFLGLLIVAAVEAFTLIFPSILTEMANGAIHALGVPAVQLVVGVSNGARWRYLVAWIVPLAAIFLISEFLLAPPLQEAGFLLGVVLFGWMAFAPDAWTTYSKVVLRRWA
jgi:hypothetical protein